MTSPRFSAAALAALLIATAATPAMAQWGRGGWGPGWGGGWASGWDRPFSSSSWGDRDINRGPDSREGKVDSDQFLAEGAAAALGKGPVAVTTIAGSSASGGDQAVYEAAMIDQLVKAGYDTAAPDPKDGQIAEIRVIRDTLVPAETKKKPVSGEMSVGVSNRGSMVGMAIAIDATKPKKALISTRLEAHLRDRATGKLLWEGHATLATREGDDHWTETAISSRLAAALFEHFPQKGIVASR